MNKAYQKEACRPVVEPSVGDPAPLADRIEQIGLNLSRAEEILGAVEAALSGPATDDECSPPCDDTLLGRAASLTDRSADIAVRLERVARLVGHRRGSGSC